MQIHSREGQLSHGLVVIKGNQPRRVACGWFTNPNRWYSVHNHIIQPHLLYIQYTYNINTVSYNLHIYKKSTYIYIYIHCIYKTIFTLYIWSRPPSLHPPLPPPMGWVPRYHPPFPSICKLLAAFLRSSFVFARSLQHF